MKKIISLFLIISISFMFAQKTEQQPPCKPTQPFGLGGILFPMLLIFLVFYFLLILPQQKQEKKRITMINNLKKGDRVLTAGGIYGYIVEVKDKVVVLKIADNVSIECSKSAISGLA